MKKTYVSHHIPPPSLGSTALHIQISVFLFLVVCLRDAVEEQAFSRLLKVLTRLSEDLQAASGEDEDLQSVTLQLQLIAECFRAQRNSCVQSTRNQSLLR